MFYLIGLGLFNVEDISLKGLNALKKVDKIYAEFFTSKLIGSNLKDIEKIIGKEIIILNRNQVEEENIFLKEAETLNVALITGGSFNCNNHSDFLVGVHKNTLYYDSWFFNSFKCSQCLQAYKFGKVTTIPFLMKASLNHHKAIEDNLKWISTP